MIIYESEKIMSHKIQIVVDDQFNNMILSGAKKMGLSVSSFARLVLTNALKGGETKLLDQAMNDIKMNAVEDISLEEFNRQLDNI